MTFNSGLVISPEMYKVRLAEKDPAQFQSATITNHSNYHCLEIGQKSGNTDFYQVVDKVNSYISNNQLITTIDHAISQGETNCLRANLLFLNKMSLTEALRGLSIKVLVRAIRISFTISSKVTDEQILEDFQETLLFQTTSRLNPSKNWLDLLQICNQVICYQELAQNCGIEDYKKILGEGVSTTARKEDYLQFLESQLTLQSTSSLKILKRASKIPGISKKMIQLFNWAVLKDTLPLASARNCSTVLNKGLCRSSETGTCLAYDRTYDEIISVNSSNYPSYCKKNGCTKSEMESKVLDKLIELFSDPVALEEEIKDFEDVYNLLINLEGLITRSFNYDKAKAEKLLDSLDGISQKMVQKGIRSLKMQKVACKTYQNIKEHRQRLERLFSFSQRRCNFSDWLDTGVLKNGLRNLFSILIKDYLGGLKKHIEIIGISGEFDQKFLLDAKEKYGNVSLSLVQNQLSSEFRDLLNGYFSDFSEFNPIVEPFKVQLDTALSELEKKHIDREVEKQMQGFTKHRTEEPKEFPYPAKVPFIIDFITPLYSSFVRLEEYVSCLSNLDEEKQEILLLKRVEKIKNDVHTLYEMYVKDFPDNFLKAVQYRCEWQNFLQALNAKIRDPYAKLSNGLLDLFLDAYAVENPESSRDDLLEKIKNNPKLLLDIKSLNPKPLSKKLGLFLDTYIARNLGSSKADLLQEIKDHIYLSATNSSNQAALDEKTDDLHKLSTGPVLSESVNLLKLFLDDYVLKNPGSSKDDILQKILLEINGPDQTLLYEKIEGLYNNDTKLVFSEEEKFFCVDKVLESWADNLFLQLTEMEKVITELVELGIIGSSRYKEDESYKKELAELGKKTSIGSMQTLYDPFTMSVQLVTSRLWMPIESYIKKLGSNHAKYSDLMTVYSRMKHLSLWANLNYK